MIHNSRVSFIKDVLAFMPSDWLQLTTHRLDIYNEAQAKFEFLSQLEELQGKSGEFLQKELAKLPTAFDYIRLGHPLSCLLEWIIAQEKELPVESVIAFSSQTMPLLAVLRKNLLTHKKTTIFYQGQLPQHFNPEVLKTVYGYQFEMVKIEQLTDISCSEGTRLLITDLDSMVNLNLPLPVDFVLGISPQLGSVILALSDISKSYISEIQHVRRRESIAMTPHDSLQVIKSLMGEKIESSSNAEYKKALEHTIQEITHTSSPVALGSSGLSVQYAIMMGLIDYSRQQHPGKAIKFIVPPNCYGGTNDQARRVANGNSLVEIIDLAVDGGQNMVESIERILKDVADEDALPYIIGEIPTNPRVEVPDLIKLKETLAQERKTTDGQLASTPVFILDQTFCPNVQFLGEGDYLSTVKTISYVSGSKFPSGGLCTAGYCVANELAQGLMSYIDLHLKICDNAATPLQIEILSKQMPSMNERISSAYKNTRAFVDFIHTRLPSAKINFVSTKLASAGFTPSVFSLDLPSKGATAEEREAHKRMLNLELIQLMIKEIPHQSKFCVSYGQLRGCYWTIPATSTQGTTKEGDKDYIVRVSLAPDFDLELHKKVFSRFCQEFIEG